MSKKVYPVNGVTYYTSDLVNLNKSIIKGKTIIGDGFKVSAKSTPSMQISVASGYALYNGYTFNSTATETITISSNTTSYPRKDIVVLNFNGANTNLKVYTGTASSSPVEPTVPNTDIQLAVITVGVNVTSIESNAIKDVRFSLGQHKMDSLDDYIYALENRIATLESKSTIRREYPGSGAVKSIIIEDNKQSKIKRQYLKCSISASEWKSYWQNISAGTNNNNGAIWCPFYDAVTPANVIDASINITNFNKWFYISTSTPKIGLCGIGGVNTTGCYVFIENKYPDESTIGVDFTVCITEKY